MPVEFNHTIIWSRDSKGLSVVRGRHLGPATATKVGPTANGVNLDFMDRKGEILSHTSRSS